MKWRLILTTMGVVGLLHSSLAFSQEGMGMGAGMGMAAGMGMGANPRFDVAPAVGEQFPDLAIVDDQGNPVNIRELASQSPYTVLTLGCLT